LPDILGDVDCMDVLVVDWRVGAHVDRVVSLPSGYVAGKRCAHIDGREADSIIDPEPRSSI
jgi:hypothetical protein